MNYIYVNRYIERLGDIKCALKNHLRYISYPDEKMSRTGWICYLSYLIVHISVVMGVISIFLFPSGVWQLFATIGAISAFVCGSVIMTYDPE